MSRTFRCKDYEQTRRDHWWRKEHGFYWEYAGGYGDWENIRALSKKEKGQQYWMWHGESSSSNARSPGPWYRLNRENSLRAFNKRELIRWRDRVDYEPMCKARPDNCWWDWM